MIEPRIQIEFNPREDRYEIYLGKLDPHSGHIFDAEPIKFGKFPRNILIKSEPCFTLSWEAAPFFMKELWRSGVEIKKMCYQEMSEEKRSILLKDLKESIDILECYISYNYERS